MKPEFKEYEEILQAELDEIIYKLQDLFAIDGVRIDCIETRREMYLSNNAIRNEACELMSRQAHLEDTILAIHEEQPIIDHAKAFDGYFARLAEHKKQTDKLDLEFTKMRENLPELTVNNEFDETIQWVD